MKTPLITLALAVLLGGCASSPLQVAKTAETGSELVGTAVGTTLSAGAGYLVGGVIKDSDASRAIGAATGAAIYLTNSEVKRGEKAKTLAEAYEEGRREGRLEAAKEYWDEVTDANGDLVRDAQRQKKTHVRQIQYDSRYVEGVNVGGGYVVDPSAGPDSVPNSLRPALKEPARTADASEVAADSDNAKN